MANNRFEELPPDHIAPVFDFYTGAQMGPHDIESLKRNAQKIFRLGIATRVFSDENLPLPEGVVSLDDARLDMQVREHTSHRPKPCLTKTYADPDIYPNSSRLPMQSEPLHVLHSSVFRFFLTQD